MPFTPHEFPRSRKHYFLPLNNVAGAGCAVMARRTNVLLTIITLALVAGLVWLGVSTLPGRQAPAKARLVQAAP